MLERPDAALCAADGGGLFAMEALLDSQMVFTVKYSVFRMMTYDH
jgi:hypothetical protein